MSLIRYWGLRSAQQRQGVTVLEVAANTNEARRVVSLRFVNSENGVFDAELVEAIRAQVRARPGMGLFEPGWIRELANENDLKLRDDFNPLHGLDRRIWLMADYLAALRVTGVKPGRTLHLTVASLRTGRVVRVLQAAESEIDTLLPAVAAAAVADDLTDPRCVGAGLCYLDHFGDCLERQDSGPGLGTVPEQWQQVFTMLPEPGGSR